MNLLLTIAFFSFLLAGASSACDISHFTGSFTVVPSDADCPQKISVEKETNDAGEVSLSVRSLDLGDDTLEVFSKIGERRTSYPDDFGTSVQKRTRQLNCNTIASQSRSCGVFLCKEWRSHSTIEKTDVGINITKLYPTTTTSFTAPECIYRQD